MGKAKDDRKAVPVDILTNYKDKESLRLGIRMQCSVSSKYNYLNRHSLPDKGLYAPVRSSQKNLNVTSKMTHYSSNGPTTAINDTQWKAGGVHPDVLAASLENSK